MRRRRQPNSTQVARSWFALNGAVTLWGPAWALRHLLPAPRRCPRRIGRAAMENVLPSNPPVLVVPGYRGSGPTHWQSLWEASNPAFRRVVQRDWDHPVLSEWIDSLHSHVASCEAAPVIGGPQSGMRASGSLGCHERPASQGRASGQSLGRGFAFAHPCRGAWLQSDTAGRSLVSEHPRR